MRPVSVAVAVKQRPSIHGLLAVLMPYCSKKESSAHWTTPQTPGLTTVLVGAGRASTAGDKGNTGGHATAHRGTPAPAPTPQARVTGDSPHAIKAVHTVASLAASFSHDIKLEVLQPNKTAPSGLMTQLVDEQLQQQQAAAHEVMQHSLLQAGSTEWLRKRPGAAFFEKLQVGKGAEAADSLDVGSSLLPSCHFGLPWIQFAVELP